MPIPELYSAPLTGLTTAQMARLAEARPKLYAEIIRQIEYERLELDREMYEDSLIAFFERAWREIDPAPVSINWHLRVIANALEDITHGLERNLIINIPPRTGKTILANVIWPAWTWAQDEIAPLSGPQVSFLCVSYGATLAEEIALKMRRLVMGDWYQSLWGGRVKLREDQTNRANFENTRGGARISNSIEGGILGRGAACLSAYTEVYTSGGVKRIEHLEIGATPEYILTYDFGSETPTYRRLVAIARRRSSALWRVRTWHGRVVEATGEHPFFTQRGWVQAMALAVGDVLLSCVPETSNAPSWRDGKMDTPPEGRPVLQPELLDGGEERARREAAAPLQRVRYNPAVSECTRQSPLQRCVPSQVNKAGSPETENDSGSTMRDMRGGVSADDAQDAGEILFISLFQQGTLGGDDGDQKSWISAREHGSLRAESSLVPSQEGSLGARSIELRSLLRNGPSASASYQCDPDRSPAGEFGVSLQDVPSVGSCGRAFAAEEDAVSLVEPICQGTDEDVFDLQIDGTECFFANGVLVHNCRIIDDPQTRRGADSEAQRAASLQGMSDLTTRITDPRTSAQVLIMQRLHENDATDWALKNWPRNTNHLMFPARFDPSRACPVDPRVREGELLWPEVWTEEELVKVERGLSALDGEVLSDFAVSGQLQQAPIPRGGGIINQDDWNMWPEWVPRAEDMTIGPDGSAFVPLPPVSHVILSLDTALSERETADWNACLVIGVWHRPSRLITIVGAEDQIDDGEQPRAILMGGWRRRCKLNDPTLGRDGRPLGLVQLIADTCRRLPVDRIIIENKTRGLDVRNELHRQFANENYHIQMFEPGRHGDKVARLHSVQPLFSQGLVYAPARCILTVDDRGNEIVEVTEFEWVRNTIAETASVPRGTHDDLADALSQGLLTLRDEGLLTLTQEYVRQQVALRMHRPKRDKIRDAYGV